MCMGTLLNLVRKVLSRAGFSWGCDPLPRAGCSVLSIPGSPNSANLTCCAALVSDHLLCKALCLTRESLLSTRPTQVSDRSLSMSEVTGAEVRKRSLSVSEELQLGERVRNGPRRPMCA